MADGDIPFLSAPLRHWRSFVPAWVILPLTPQILLRGANEDRLLLYFWLFAVPLLVVAFWPLVRLHARNCLNLVDIWIWIIAVPMSAAAAVHYLVAS